MRIYRIMENLHTHTDPQRFGEITKRFDNLFELNSDNFKYARVSTTKLRDVKVKVQILHLYNTITIILIYKTYIHKGKNILLIVS